MALTYVFSSLVGLYTATAAVIDIREHRVPNYLTVTAAIVGLLFNTFMPNGIGIGMSLAGFAIGFCLLLVPWLLGGGGMGDVKLLAALGAWLGPKYILIAFAISVLLAAGLACCMLVKSTFTEGVTTTKRRYLKQTKSHIGEKRKRRRVLPFAVPVCVSTWILLIWTTYQALVQIQG